MALVQMDVTAIDCPDPRALAAFYGAVLGWETDPAREDTDWVELVGPTEGHRLAFQQADDYQPPRWPSAEHGQQMHLDLKVPRDRMDEAEQQVLALGARLLQGDDDGRRSWRVYADPVGHPFCLCAC
ncbi:VOC family protein [Streptomyces sp. TRM70308]|uniref:VOC family protein n=1 Tax=Streptomyces sp. TRM70308 TaxID=3131932 RepID=UPI003D04E809